MLTKEKKVESSKMFRSHDKDTGSSSVQIGILTARINDLSNHLSVHKKDFSSRVGLLKLVGQRRRLLNYLGKTDIKSYQKTISELKLRK